MNELPDIQYKENLTDWRLLDMENLPFFDFNSLNEVIQDYLEENLTVEKNFLRTLMTSSHEGDWKPEETAGDLKTYKRQSEIFERSLSVKDFETDMIIWKTEWNLQSIEERAERYKEIREKYGDIANGGLHAYIENIEKNKAAFFMSDNWAAIKKNFPKAYPGTATEYIYHQDYIDIFLNPDKELKDELNSVPQNHWITIDREQLEKSQGNAILFIDIAIEKYWQRKQGALIRENNRLILSPLKDTLITLDMVNGSVKGIFSSNQTYERDGNTLTFLEFDAASKTDRKNGISLPINVSLTFDLDSEVTEFTAFDKEVLTAVDALVRKNYNTYLSFDGQTGFATVTASSIYKCMRGSGVNPNASQIEKINISVKKMSSVTFYANNKAEAERYNVEEFHEIGQKLIRIAGEERTVYGGHVAEVTYIIPVRPISIRFAEFRKEVATIPIDAWRVPRELSLTEDNLRIKGYLYECALRGERNPNYRKIYFENIYHVTKTASKHRYRNIKAARKILNHLKGNKIIADYSENSQENCFKITYARKSKEHD